MPSGDGHCIPFQCMIYIHTLKFPKFFMSVCLGCVYPFMNCSASVVLNSSRIAGLQLCKSVIIKVLPLYSYPPFIVWPIATS